MNKFALTVAAMLTLSGVAACNNAKAPDGVSNDVATARDRASSNVADAQQNAAKDTDAAQAKMNDQGVDLNKANAKGIYDVAMAKADGDHKVSSAKCESMSGDAQKTCKQEADAQYDLAKAHAKAAMDAQTH